MPFDSMREERLFELGAAGLGVAGLSIAALDAGDPSFLYSVSRCKKCNRFYVRDERPGFFHSCKGDG